MRVNDCLRKVDYLENNKIEMDVYLIELFVYILLSLNKKFIQPEDNLLMDCILIVIDEGLQKDYKVLSEKILNLFNLEGKIIFK